MIDRFFNAVEAAFPYVFAPLCVAVAVLNFLPPQTRRQIYDSLLSLIM